MFYSTAIIYTDVVRAILLFYLTPVWATILARIFLGDAITVTRIVAMAVADGVAGRVVDADAEGLTDFTQPPAASPSSTPSCAH